MANKYTAHQIPDKQELERLYCSGLTQQQIGEKYGVTQKVVYTWFKKLKIKSRVPKNTHQYGADNPNWRGDKAGYSALHYRVAKIRGTPMVCSKCGTTTAKKYEWASVTKNYADPYDYIRLCKSCHSKFDNMSKNFNKKGGDSNEIL